MGSSSNLKKYVKMTVSLSKLQKDLLAGLSSGSMSTVVSHPLDLIKVRLQLSVTKTLGLTYSRILKDILKGGNVFREAYRGLGVNLLGNSLTWTLYFGIYRSSKDIAFKWFYANKLDDIKSANDDILPTPLYFASATFTGLLTTLLTNPIWVLKTRIMATSTKGPYKSVFDGIQKIYHKEGIGTFWKGLVPSLLGVSQGAIYFSLYDTLKFHYLKSKHGKGEQKLSSSNIIGITCISKMLSVVSVYPIQLIKSNLQSFSSRSSILGLVRTVYNNEGLPGFYRGVTVNLVKAIPTTCTTFLVYEKVWHAL